MDSINQQHLSQQNLLAQRSSSIKTSQQSPEPSISNMSTEDFKKADMGPIDKDLKLMEDGVITATPEGNSRKVSASFAIDPAAERRLVWKFDLRILPTLAVMYLFNSLDKSNLGNAKTAGL